MIQVEAGERLRIRVSDGVIDTRDGTDIQKEEMTSRIAFTGIRGMQIDAGSRRRCYFGRKKENGSTGTTEPGREFFRSGRTDRTAGSRGYFSGGSFHGVQQGHESAETVREQIDRVEKQVMKLNEEGGLEPLDPQ